MSSVAMISVEVKIKEVIDKLKQITRPATILATNRETVCSTYLPLPLFNVVAVT